MEQIPTFIKGPGGSIILSDLASHVKGALLVPSSGQAVVTLAAAGGGAGNNAFGTPVIVEAPTDAYFEIFTLMQTGAETMTNNVLLPHNGNGFVQIKQNVGTLRVLMNRPILIFHVFGSVVHPFYLDDWAETILLEPQQTLIIEMQNANPDGGTSLAISMEGRKFQTRSWKQPVVKNYLSEALNRRAQISPYWLTCDNNLTSAPGAPGLTLAGSAQGEVTFTNKNDTCLVLSTFQMTVRNAEAGTGESISKASVQIFDPRTRKPLQNQPIRSLCAGGTPVSIGILPIPDCMPYVLPTPIIVEPSQSIRAVFTNLVDTSVDIYPTFGGCALWTYGKSGGYQPDGSYLEDPLPIVLERKNQYA